MQVLSNLLEFSMGKAKNSKNFNCGPTNIINGARISLKPRPIAPSMILNILVECTSISNPLSSILAILKA